MSVHAAEQKTSLVNLCVPNKVNHYKPPVRSIVLKLTNAKAKRGARLIDFKSLIQHLEKQYQVAA
jgi:hypothetical protein